MINTSNISYLMGSHSFRNTIIILGLVQFFICHLISQHSYLHLNIDSLEQEVEAARASGNIDLEYEQERKLGSQFQIRNELEKSIEVFDRLASRCKEFGRDSLSFLALDNVAAGYYFLRDEVKTDSVCDIIKNSQNVPAIVMGSAYYLSAFFKDHKGMYDEAFNDHQISLKHFKNANDSIKIPLALRHLGTIAKSQGHQAQALKYYQEAIPYYRPGSSTHMLVINLLNSINAIYYENQNYPQALEYSSRILNLLHLVKNEELKHLYYFLHAKNLDALNHPEAADSLFNKAVQFFKNESPKSPYRLQVMLGLLTKNLKENNLSSAKILLDSMKMHEARFFREAKFHSMVTIKMNYYKQKCEYYLKTSQLDKLEEELNKIKGMLLTNEDLALKRTYSHYSGHLYKARGNFELALIKFEEGNILDDSLHQIQQLVLLQDAEIRYQKAELENEIALLNSDNEITLLKLQSSKRRNWIFGIGLLAFVLLSSILFWLYKKINAKNAIIQQADKEKSILLQEIHHRVKNNLQVVSSLLALQGKYVSDDSATDALKQGQDRVQSMALIHQDLYQTDNLKGVSTKDYFEQVVDHLFDSYNISEDKIELELDVMPMMLDVDTMIPLGLITNELVSNSLKHAFANQKNGKIKVHLKETENILILEVSDNGIGIQSIDDIEGKSFGYELIKAFAQKLKADISIDHSNGFVMQLRIQNYKLAA